ncbi:MAG: XRE family transcriptional regulator, partial [Proteobacteria bacterium]|nr:XRE family transcriptional regulator [Pseudomonadota bacterium]
VRKALRYWRLKREMSQQEVAAAVGVTYQMVQKYEAAESRVSVGRLCDLATALGVEIVDLVDCRG